MTCLQERTYTSLAFEMYLACMHGTDAIEYILNIYTKLTSLKTHQLFIVYVFTDSCKDFANSVALFLHRSRSLHIGEIL